MIGPVKLKLGTAEAKAIYQAAAGNPPTTDQAAYRTAMRKLQNARFPNEIQTGSVLSAGRQR